MIDCQFINRTIARQESFVYSAVGTQDVTQTRPAAFVRVDMDFANTISIVITCPFILSVAQSMAYAL